MTNWHQILTIYDQINVPIHRVGLDMKNPHCFCILNISTQIELKFCKNVKYDNLTSNIDIIWPNQCSHTTGWVGTKNHHWFWNFNISTQIELNFCTHIKYDNLTSNIDNLWPNQCSNTPGWVGSEKLPLVFELEYFKSKVKILELNLTTIIYKNGELFLPFATVYYISIIKGCLYA